MAINRFKLPKAEPCPFLIGVKNDYTCCNGHFMDKDFVIMAGDWIKERIEAYKRKGIHPEDIGKIRADLRSYARNRFWMIGYDQYKKKHPLPPYILDIIQQALGGDGDLSDDDNDILALLKELDNL